MDESPIPAPPRKPWLPFWLMATGIIAFAVFSASIAGLTIWLFSHRSAPAPAPTTVAQRDATPSPERNDPIAPTTTSASSPEADFVNLFNGRDLADWDYNPAAWTVRDGIIRGRSGNSGSALFWAKGEVDNFELRFQFRLIGGNSGVYYRAQQLDKFDAGGYEFEIYTNRIGNLADNGQDREKRRLFYQDFDKAPKTDTEWHEGTIIAIGGRFVHRLDGKDLCQVEDAAPKGPRSGLLAFHLSNATSVEFREIRLKRIAGN
jgi:hypothetical protein